MLTIDCERLELRPGMRVLDAGCGQGRHSLELLRRGCRPAALDVNVADLRYARYLLAHESRERHAAAAGQGAEPDAYPPLPFVVLRGDAERLPFPDGAFDRVLCSEVLEHVASPERAAAELARVLKPAGLLAVSVPTPATEWAMRYSSDDYFNSPGGHVRIFTYPRLRGLLAAEGLEVVDLHFEHAFHSLYWWVRCVFGLHAEQHPAIRTCKKVLTHVLFSPALTRAERWLNWVWPKSMVVYAHRRGAA
jgi:ubiquinone/menaquinone biosynthesis C-methylase UbiE